VVIANWNGLRYLKNCLSSVRSQTYNNIEVIIVDNASRDGSLDFIRQNYPDVTLIQNPKNNGFAPAQNQAIKIARGDYILCLNQDVILEKDYLEKMIPAMEADPKVGSAACKLVFCKSENYAIFESTGHVVSMTRSFFSRGHNENDGGQYDKKCFVFGVCAAAAVYKRQMLEDIKLGEEYFDESYHSYLEDIDVDWRAQLRGWKCLYVPEAVATHESLHPGLSRVRSFKNRLLTIIKNEQTVNFLIDSPYIVIYEINNLVYKYLGDPRYLSAIIDVLRKLPGLLRKRRIIQKGAIVPPSYIRGLFVMDTDDKDIVSKFVVSIFIIAALIYIVGFFKLLLLAIIAYGLLGGLLRSLFWVLSKKYRGAR
jgi:GT2 family glycosyltransferase